MQTGQIVSQCVVGGISFPSTVTRYGEGQVSHVVALIAGATGLINDGVGVDGMETGHGITGAMVIDVHWDDPGDGTHKCRRGLLVDTANANDIEFDEVPAGLGDALPADETPVIVSEQVIIDTDWEADLLAMIASKCTQRAVADFWDLGGSELTLKQVAGEAWTWASDQGVANPLDGDTVDLLYVSNGSATAATFYLGLLYQSV